MTNITELIHALNDYQSTLSRHLVSTRERFEIVERSWIALSDCYAGQGAEEFRPEWEKTATRFNEYLDYSAQLSILLEQKSKQLKQADRPLS